MASKKEDKVLSVLDLNARNIWNTQAHEIAELWESGKEDEDFATCEDKALNIIRLNFEVVHYDPENEREKAKYEGGAWEILTHTNPKRGNVAIRKREIKSISDLSYENVRHISTPLLLELIDRNFGGGWDSIQLSMKDIIESGFEISTTTLPTSRLHAAGGTYERKMAAGFDVLEIEKGTWTEAIFAKKKELVEKVTDENDSKYDEDGYLRSKDDDEDDEDYDDNDNLIDNDDNDDDDVTLDDDTFISAYSEEAAINPEDDEEYGNLNID
ncbi:MAG: hypothetical protein KBT12_02695 [Bacteroidales bacterium]|nr:hypothetical protein [Candidatus Physcousia equi]